MSDSTWFGRTSWSVAFPATVVLLLAVTGIMIGCSGPEDGALQGGAPLSHALSCGVGPMAGHADPWLPNGSDYALTSSQGDGNVWFGQISGAALVVDRLFVFDAEESHVLVFDDRLASVADSFGSEGEGPGEFAGVPYPSYGVSRWLVPGGPEELVVFDGYRLQRFGADGHYLGTAMPSPALGTEGLTPNTPRFGWAQDSVFFFAGGYDPFSSMSLGSASEDSSPIFYGRVEVKGERRDLLAIPLPRRPDGPVGPRQARPYWAPGPECLWANDGSRPVFHRVRRDGFGRDSIVVDLELPDPPDREDGATALLRQMGVDERFPEPNALWRIHDLLFDPDGRLWIRLNSKRSSGSGVTVAVLEPRSGETVVFQVPAFPLVFGSPGVFYATFSGSMSEPLLGRFELEPKDVHPSSHQELEESVAPGSDSATAYNIAVSGCGRLRRPPSQTAMRTRSLAARFQECL